MTYLQACKPVNSGDANILLAGKTAVRLCSGMDNETPIRPTDLAEKLGISVPYASQLLSGARVPSLTLAIEYFEKSGVRLGPLVSKSDEQIETLRQALAA